MSTASESGNSETIPSQPKISLEDFLNRSSEHKLVSRHYYNVEDTSVLIKLIRLGNDVGSEFLKFEFEEPIYLKPEKVYCDLQQRLLVLAPPFLYTDSATEGNGGFKISQAYEVCCDLCGNKINYINTNLSTFYCDTCFIENESIDEKNVIVVLGGTLAE